MRSETEDTTKFNGRWSFAGIRREVRGIIPD
jgi:hypothetical protein